MYMFKSKYNDINRHLMVWDADGIWIGTPVVTHQGVVTHKMTHENPRLVECENFELTDGSLRSFAINAAYDSGIDQDVMFDIEANSTVVAAGWTYKDIKPFKKSSGDPIFDAWMNR